jgi:hypothetical protein
MNYLYNEILTNGWEHDSSLPIEAFFYSINDGVVSEKERETALSDRDLYFEQKGVYLPVVGMDLNKKDNPFVIEE